MQRNSGNYNDTEGRSGQAGPTVHASSESRRTFWLCWNEHHDYLSAQSIRFMCGNRADAEDALSIARLKASQHFGRSGIEVRNRRAWLRSVLFNVCMDMHRRQRRQSELIRDAVDSQRGLATRFPYQRSNPEDIIQQREALRKLLAEIGHLPAILREPLSMRVLLNMPYKEVAARLRITLCTARKRVQLAREQLLQRAG